MFTIYTIYTIYRKKALPHSSQTLATLQSAQAPTAQSPFEDFQKSKLDFWKS